MNSLALPSPGSVPREISWAVGDTRRVLLAGDWHGNDRAAAGALKAAAHLNIPVVLQLGDFGLWPGEEGVRYLAALEAAAAELGVLVAWIDGNHEDFSQLAEVPVGGDGLRWFSPHVVHVPRGSRWSWQGVRFAALGGATSLDRPSRALGKSWWVEESVNDVDLSVLAAGGDCDVLLTHDCPAGVDIPGIGHRNYVAAVSSGWSLGELERAWDHRDRIREAVDSVRPLHLWHGHYHLRYSAEAVLHDRGVTAVEGLSWDGDALEKRVLVAVLSDGAVELLNVHKALDLS